MDETIKVTARITGGRVAGASAPGAALVEGGIRATFFAKLTMAAALTAGLMLASLLTISSPGWSGQDPAAADKPHLAGGASEVTVAIAKRSRWERTTNQPGTVKAFGSVDVYARISGYLKRLQVDIGSRVKKGDILAEIDAPGLASAVERARAEVDRAKVRIKRAEVALRVSQAAADVEHARIQAATSALAESETKMQSQRRQVDRMRDLVERRLVDPASVNDAVDRHASTLAGVNTARSQLAVAAAAEAEVRAKIEAARLDVEEAMSELRIAKVGLDDAQTAEGYTRIMSPLDGVVTRCSFHVGALVRSADVGHVDPILTVVRTDIMRVVVAVPDREAPYVDPGDSATLRIDALGARGVLQGRVARTAYALDPKDHTLRAEFDLPNADGRLRPGQDGRVEINLESRADVLTIPSSAIFGSYADGTRVCLHVAEGRAARARIKVGVNDGRRSEILEGLNEGDIIIANPDVQMPDGQVVTIRRDRDKRADR